eukprot:4366996-Pyramimonas_sp.AAC.1
MSLSRIGWVMSHSMTIRDDRGFVIPLGLFSTALVTKKLRKEAYLRMLERDSASKRWVKYPLCYDIVKETLSSKKFSALEKGRIRAFATEAFPTEKRAPQLGYQEDAGCQFCGQAGN